MHAGCDVDLVFVADGHSVVAPGFAAGLIAGRREYNGERAFRHGREDQTRQQ